MEIDICDPIAILDRVLRRAPHSVVLAWKRPIRGDNRVVRQEIESNGVSVLGADRGGLECGLAVSANANEIG